MSLLVQFIDKVWTSLCLCSDVVPPGGAAGAVRGLGRPCDHAALMAVCMAMGRLMGAGRDVAAVFALLQVVWS